MIERTERPGIAWDSRGICNRRPVRIPDRHNNLFEANATALKNAMTMPLLKQMYDMIPGHVPGPLSKFIEIDFSRTQSAPSRVMDLIALTHAGDPALWEDLFPEKVTVRINGPELNPETKTDWIRSLEADRPWELLLAGLKERIDPS